jgi:small-conductance mechanosensitive channel
MPASKNITLSPEAYAANQAELARLRAQVKQLPPSDLHAQLDALRAENLRLQTQVQANQPKAKSPITLSAKGCVVLNLNLDYPDLGLGWPIALYPGQWEQIFTIEDELKALVAQQSA